MIRNATLSPSGRLIAYTGITTADNLIGVPVSPTTNESTGRPSPMSNEPGTHHFGPAFSLDGSKIAFSAQRRGTPFNIWMTNATRGNLTQLTVDGGRFPSWYPDGKQLVFVSVRQGQRRLWSIASVGGNEKSLFELDDIENPRLSPDGRQVAFNFTKEGIINEYRRIFHLLQ